MFKQRFIRLCNERGVSPSAACSAIGLSNATFSCWTDESVPRKATLTRIADYFGVSVSYLLGLTDEPSVVLSDQVIANLSANVQRVVDELDKQKKPVPGLNPKLSYLLDQMNADELEDLEKYAEFILSRKK